MDISEEISSMKNSSKKTVSTQSDTQSQMKSQLSITSPIGIDLAEPQHQIPPSHSSSLAESQPTSASDLASPIMKMEPKEASEEDGHHKGPKRVTVLSTTKPFIYDKTEEKRMFHATVATETEFFRVMLFDETLQEMFAKRNPIVLTDYFCSNGTLMIHKASSVSAAMIAQK
ncbi:interferon-activable protein 203-like [Peromyscus maniculatus bairdii]|uniref:interferon-activable protein 203-like n=1 Tax=Peromyscus maniculatus bairdii TaxID=230844 RepID=UPI003FD268E1